MDSERRRFWRVHQEFEVAYRPSGELMESWRIANTVTLSAGGMRFRSSEFLEVGTEIEIELRVPSEPHPLALRGRIVANNVQITGGSENSVEFVEVAEEQEIHLY